MVGALTSAQGEIFFTFWVSGLAAIASLPIGLAVAQKLVRRDRYGRLWWFLVTVPLAVPPPLIGID